MTHTPTFVLLANSRAFLESAVDYAEKGRSDENQFAILHLATAIELLVKATLAAKDPQLLVEGSKRISEDVFARGEFRSVGPDEALKRAADAGLLLLNDRQKKQLSLLRNIRNRVTHYTGLRGEVDARAIVATGVHLFIELHNAAFHDDDVYGAKSMSEIARGLCRHDAFVNERMGQLRDPLRGATRPLTHHFDECSNCLQDAAVLIDDRMECLFCGLGAKIYEYAEAISDDGSAAECPACHRQSVAHFQRRQEDPTNECFCCGYFTGHEINWRDHEGHRIPRLKGHL